MSEHQDSALRADKRDGVHEDQLAEEAIRGLWLAERRLGQMGWWRQANRVGRLRSKVRKSRQGSLIWGGPR